MASKTSANIFLAIVCSIFIGGGIAMIIIGSILIQNDNNYKNSKDNNIACNITSNISYWDIDDSHKDKIRESCIKYFNVSSSNDTKFDYCINSDIKCVAGTNTKGIALICLGILIMIMTFLGACCAMFETSLNNT
jgi:hypothetical protein